MTHALRSDLTLFGRWTAARVRLTFRVPRALVFTFAFPLTVLVLFSALNSGHRVAAGSTGQVSFTQFYTPSIAVFSLCTACYTTLALGLSTARDLGVLKRVRGTLLPMPAYLAAWLAGAVLVGLAAVVVMFVVAMPAFGVHLYARLLPAAVVTAVLGAVALGALGLALAASVRTARSGLASRPRPPAVGGGRSISPSSPPGARRARESPCGGSAARSCSPPPRGRRV